MWNVSNFIKQFFENVQILPLSLKLTLMYIILLYSYLISWKIAHERHSWMYLKHWYLEYHGLIKKSQKSQPLYVFLFLTPYLLSYNILKLFLWTDIYNCKKIMIKSYLNVLSFTSYWHHIHICIIIKRIIIVNASFTSLRNWGILWT